jgi:SAM-dependent methyltransferase
MNERALKDRFEFGRNWQEYAELVDEDRIAEAKRRLAEMLRTDDLAGRSFLDVGCGSGLHSLAALRMGAGRVVAIDLDPRSVATTAAVLERFAPGHRATVKEMSAFDLEALPFGRFDVVYSWGVLHHTGDMARAIKAAAGCTKPGGLFAVALYGKTRYCGMWKRIKRWYINASPDEQAWAERTYVRLFGAYLLLRGKCLGTHIRNYNRKRGMDFHHDVRDWIGGYPYESIAPDELAGLLAPLGFEIVWKNVKRRSGLFGSGNDEFLLRCAASSLS